MKIMFPFVALTVVLTTSLVAVAADVPAKDTAPAAASAPTEQVAKAEPAKKKVKPHSHVEAKGGTVSAQSTEAKEPAGKPLHDHLKIHKQM